ncbi:MAG TPA: pyridoxine 5'-phosphate synthase, partial [Balneolaceae bacterium]|nr:pyridoxine 5'-phosphate synthase [Balneolaceae bacterium]
YDDFEKRVFPAFRKTDIEISLFVDPNPVDIELAAKLGSDAIELHTGTFANAQSPDIEQKELNRLKEAAVMAHEAGMQVNAGHGLNLNNLGHLVDSVPHLKDISIGHALVSQSLFWGLDKTVKAYIQIMNSK